MGRPYNELPLLQLQRQHERQEDKARLRLQPRLLSGSDSQRQRGFPQAEQTQFCPETGNVSRELSGAARSGRLGAAVLASLLQRHHSSVSTMDFLNVLFRFFFFFFASERRYPWQRNARGPIRTQDFFANRFHFAMSFAR